MTCLACQATGLDTRPDRVTVGAFSFVLGCWPRFGVPWVSFVLSRADIGKLTPGPEVLGADIGLVCGRWLVGGFCGEGGNSGWLAGWSEVVGSMHIGSFFIYVLGMRAHGVGGAAGRKCTRFLLVSPVKLSTCIIWGRVWLLQVHPTMDRTCGGVTVNESPICSDRRGLLALVLVFFCYSVPYRCWCVVTWQEELSEGRKRSTRTVSSRRLIFLWTRVRVWPSWGCFCTGG